MSTWDQIRSEVRSFRASVQPTVTTIRDFTFDSKRDRIYFLASDLAKSPKSPMLFYVDLPHTFAESDSEMDEQGNSAAGSTVDTDDADMDDTDQDESQDEQDHVYSEYMDSDLAIVVTAGSGVFTGGGHQIQARSDHHPHGDQHDDSNDDKDLDLVPFDPTTYQFVELAHPPQFLPSVVGSYPRENTPAPASIPPCQADKGLATASIQPISDAAVEDILGAAPVLEWVPVLSEEWIKEHHATYMLSRNDLHRHSEGPPRIATGITQYQFEPQLNRLVFPYGDEIYMADIPKSGKIHPEPVVPRHYPSSGDVSRSPSSSLVIPQPSSPSIYFISGASPQHSPKAAARIPLSASVSSIASTAATSTTAEDHLEGSGNGGAGAGAAGTSPHVRMDPKLGGTSMNLIAFTRTRDLWVMTTSGVETQLTFCSRNKSNTAISCGIPEFIMQEEFHRFTNYYWAPQPLLYHPTTMPSSHSASTNGTAAAASSRSSSLSSIASNNSSSSSVGGNHHHNAPLPVVTPKGLQTRPKERILYLQVSEAMVDVVMIPRQGIHPEVEEYRYPHAGAANAVSDIQIVEFVPKQHEDDIVPEPLHKRLWGRSSIYKLCPWLEYIVRFGWMPSGDSIWAQILDRRQQVSALVMIPLECFQSVTEHANSTQQTEEELANRIKVIFEERSDYWINVTDIMYLFPLSEPSRPTITVQSNRCRETIQCIVASERTGFRHLYLLTHSPGSGSSVVPITAGEYQVVDKPISVDLGRRLVYFTAKRDTVLETHLYVASFASGANPHHHVRRLTHLGHSHQVTMDLTHDRFVTLFSSIEQSPTCSVMHLRWDECKLKQTKQQQRHHPGGRNSRTVLRQESKKSNLARGGVGTPMDAWWHRWCDCGCHLPKISSYALLLREGIRNRSAKEVRDHPIVPPSPVPSQQPATSPEIANGVAGRALRRASGIMGVNGTMASSSGNGSTNSNGVRSRKSLSGFLASHLLSPGILQAPKFTSQALSGSDSSLMMGATGSSSRSRTKSAPRLGGVFSSSAHSASSSSSSSSSGVGGMGGIGGGVNDGGGGGGDGGGDGGMSSSPMSAGSIGMAVNANHHPAGEFFTFQSSDEVTLHGCLYRPVNYVAGNKYPTLVSIYGGPKSQMVTNEYKLPKFLRVFLATRMGYAVVMFDGRGSNERGIEFEGRLRHRMGQVEIQDQVEGLRFLARPENGGIVDMDRVAITGWSYGGYLSLMALVQYPEVFKLAIAGAPVTQWELYNSAYTERYMGLLSENKEGYTKSNVLNWIEKFPDSENRLLIAHGLIDENVHFKNTETLSAELIRFNKPHHIQLYPTERHGLRDARVNEHFETLMFYWLRNYL